MISSLSIRGQRKPRVHQDGGSPRCAFGAGGRSFLPARSRSWRSRALSAPSLPGSFQPASDGAPTPRAVRRHGGPIRTSRLPLRPPHRILQEPLDFRLQARLFRLHARIAHRLMLARIRLHPRSVDRHVVELGHALGRAPEQASCSQQFLHPRNNLHGRHMTSIPPNSDERAPDGITSSLYFQAVQSSALLSQQDAVTRGCSVAICIRAVPHRDFYFRRTYRLRGRRIEHSKVNSIQRLFAARVDSKNIASAKDNGDK